MGQQEVTVLLKMQTVLLLRLQIDQEWVLSQGSLTQGLEMGWTWGSQRATPEPPSLFFMTVLGRMEFQHLHAADMEGGILKDRAHCPGQCSSVRGLAVGPGMWGGTLRWYQPRNTW